MLFRSLKTGDEIWFTHVPKVGLQCKIDKNETVIKDVAFAQAVWEIYLGKKNIGESIKTDLTSRLKKDDKK